MLPVRRNGLRVARQLRAGPQRRFAHDNHGHHAEVPSESLGRGFWTFLSVVPLSYSVYALSRPSADGEATQFTKLIESFTTKREEWERRNTLHTAMIEQAAFDRNLFQSDRGSQQIPMKFPEVFNTGSAINVRAGHYSNIDNVIAHYKEENRKQAAKTQARLERGEQIG